MRRIFIVSCAKSGSKMIANVLMACPDVAILSELHYRAPRIVRKDVVAHARDIGSLNDDENVRKFVEAMYDRRFEGPYWVGVDHLTRDHELGKISDIEPQVMRQRLLDSDRTHRSVMAIMLEEGAKAKGKSITGSKSPVNIVCTEELLAWFPDSKLINLVRDPRAIYVSMLKERLSRESSWLSLKTLLHQFIRFVYVCYQYRAMLKVHLHHRSSADYYFLKYEDFIDDPEKQVRELCRFCAVDFTQEMLSPPTGAGSFYGAKMQADRGFDRQAKDRWKERIPPVYRRLLERLLRKEMREFGYE